MIFCLENFAARSAIDSVKMRHDVIMHSIILWQAITEQSVPLPFPSTLSLFYFFSLVNLIISLTIFNFERWGGKLIATYVFFSRVEMQNEMRTPINDFIRFEIGGGTQPKPRRICGSERRIQIKRNNSRMFQNTALIAINKNESRFNRNNATFKYEFWIRWVIRQIQINFRNPSKLRRTGMGA